MMSKFSKINGIYFLLVNKKRYSHNYTDTFLVKANGTCGRIALPKDVHLPKECIGKRIKIMMEVQEEPEPVPKKDQPKWMRDERKKARRIGRTLSDTWANKVFKRIRIKK